MHCLRRNNKYIPLFSTEKGDKILKKLCGIIGAIVIIAALAVGGIYVYNNYIKKNVGEFQIQYSYEDYMGLGNRGYVAGYKGVSPENVVISETFEQDGSKRTTYGIKINAFKDNTNMKSVDIPATVKFISANSFVGCTNLETIIFRATESSGLTYSGGFVAVDKETVTVKVANDEIKVYMETVFTKATIVVDSTLAE